MTTPTVDTILELAREARRSPHARRVLHDALIDRYGDDYLFTVERAQKSADENEVGFMVILRPDRLRAADAALMEERRRPGGGYTLPTLENWHAMSRLAVDYRTFRSRVYDKDSIVVVVLRPRSRFADTSRPEPAPPPRTSRDGATKALRTLRSIAEAQGWRVERTRASHFRFIPPDRTKKIVLFSPNSSPQNVRNVYAELRRSGLVLPEGYA